MEAKIRIYKILPVYKGLENWGPLHEELLAEISHDGVKVVQVDLPDVPIASISSSYEADIVAPAHTQAAVRGEAEGFDAVIMGCLLEPGVSAAKELLRIPVVGDTGAAIHLASLVAPRFSFVLPGAKPGKGDRALADIVGRYGFANHLASIRRVAAPTLAFARQEAGLAEVVVNEAKLAIEEDGAQAIVGYGGLDIIRELRSALPVPVVSAIQATVLVAEALARARLSQSKIAFAEPARGGITDERRGS